MKSQVIQTPLGAMLAVADERSLHMVQFCDVCDDRFERGESPLLEQVKQQLEAYFSGELQQFSLLLAFKGTPFQRDVWEGLLSTHYGETISYKELAERVGNPRACRAVGTANGANQFAVIVPCHRVIQEGGGIGGYGGGLERKRWLLEHEQGEV